MCLGSSVTGRLELSGCAGMAAISEKQLNEAEKSFRRYEAMINSMTKEERTNPDLLALSSSRRHDLALIQRVARCFLA